MNPVEMFLTLIIVGLAIIDVTISALRGKMSVGRAVATVVIVIVLCAVASAIF